MFDPVGRFKPVSVQLLPDRVPFPIDVLRGDSKVARESNGLDPVRVHVTVLWVTVTFCVAGVSLVRRAKQVRVCPPIVPKIPPARTFPAGRRAIEVTSPFEFGSQESASPVEASTRAILLRDCPPMVANCPPRRILPSDCTAVENTLPLAFGFQESASPVDASSRAIRLRVCPPIVVN